MTPEEKLAHLQKQNKMVEEEVSILQYLQRLYPDLEVVTNRWHKEYYVSEKVNPIATEYHTWHGCACCVDSPLYCNPYVKEGNITIYAKPLNICIGEKCTSTEIEDIHYSNWREILRSHNINEAIIQKIEGKNND